MTTLKTILHAYEFDTNEPEGKAAWNAFKAERKKGPYCFGPVFHEMGSTRLLDGVEIELETKHLFENQWDTAPVAGISENGFRVFDWFLQADHGSGLKNSAPRGIKRGHYLEQTGEMRELRRNTNCCGYCGYQEAAAKGSVFCPKCIDSEYLKESDLKLLRMRPVDEGSATRPELSEAERAHLLPIYKSAQLHGNTERGRRRAEKARADAIAMAEKAIKVAVVERDGMLWLLDNGIDTANVIFYSHTGKFSFGWRRAIGAAVLAGLLEVLPEFPFPYEIKCEDGRKLDSGNGSALE